MAGRREVAPLLQRVRAFLLGREHTIALRFEDGISDRTQPPPEIPGGPAHVLSANYYCKRDARREVAPPIDVGPQQLLSATGSKTKTVKLPTPGRLHQWD